MDKILFEPLNIELLYKIIEKNIELESESSYPTSNCLFNGHKENIFYKKLNYQKIRELYKGNYLNLFSSYYSNIKKIMPVNKILGIIEYNNNLYEFSDYIENSKLLDGSNTFNWKQISILFDKILNYINQVIDYQKKSGIDIGFETAIWNFTIDGVLFDLDPPKLLNKFEDSSFTRKQDKNHVKRTLYRSFDEIGMKSNLLVTLILGLKHNSFIVKDMPKNYLNYFLNKILESMTEEKVKELFVNQIKDGLSVPNMFGGHPIEIIRGELKLKSNAAERKYIFVAGTSESGKSGAINYLKEKYDTIQHIKIRDVFPKVYEDTMSKISYQEWQEFEEKRDLNNFWNLFMNKVYELCQDDKSVIIMDTMYGVEGMKELYKILGDKVELIYIDAPLDKRILREYKRLRLDSENGTRKADLSITLEEITEKTVKKDKIKNSKGADLLKKLVYSETGNGLTISSSDKEQSFPYIIENDDTIEEFHSKLDEYMKNILGKNNSSTKSR